VGKTEGILEATRGHKVLYCKSGQLTPLSFYLRCFAHRNEPIILDDVEHLLSDPLGRKLVSALGDTGSEKIMSWHSASRRLEDVPAEFTTNSPLCIIANASVTDRAIQNRAVILDFDPSNEEVHRSVVSWFWDQEIHDWIGRQLARLQPIDARGYLHAANDKLAGRDWQQLFLQANAMDVAECLVQNLESDPAYATVKDRIRRFGEVLGSEGGSKANYHNIKRRLKKRGCLLAEPTVGVIPLRGRRPVRVTPGDNDTTPSPPAADIPLREQFARPINGAPAATPTRGPEAAADDSVGWERPPSTDEDEG
jgi:hypothetical protein